MARSFTKASTTQVIAIHRMLEEEVEKLEGGLCQYKNPDVSDATLAEKSKASVNTVARIRQEMFGKVRRASVDAETAADIRGLKEQLAELTDKHNKLCVTLSLEKIANVKHLAVGNGAAHELRKVVMMPPAKND